MAKVKFEMDTDSDWSTGFKPAARFTQRTFHVVTTIKLSQPLRDAFEQGAGERPRYFSDIDYDKITGYIKCNHNDPEFFVVTAGGSVAFNAAKAELTNTKFVSLVGITPLGNIGNCFGGVTLKTVDKNLDRVEFLESKGRPRAGIGLFCNKKSAMNKDEVDSWATIPGVNQNIAYGGNSGGKNDSNTYPNDFAAVHSSITTLVISADPYFQNTKNKLIKAANDWVAGNAARHVCYPLKDFENSDGNHQPTTGKSWWCGPSLETAYNELGRAAALARTASNPIGFSDIVATEGPF